MFGRKPESNIPDSQIFVYFDSKAKAYGLPMFSINQHALIRDVVNMLRDPQEQVKSQLYLNAEDFAIFKIGTYDKSTGTITGQPPEHIVNMHDLRAMVADHRTTKAINEIRDAYALQKADPEGVDEKSRALFST